MKKLSDPNFITRMRGSDVYAENISELFELVPPGSAEFETALPFGRRVPQAAAAN